MANQYGTKTWAKWAEQTLGFALILLREPNKQWDKELSYQEAAVKSLGIVQNELEKILIKEGG